MKIHFLLLVLLWNSLLLTGCWDRKEINDVALVTGLGIDQKNKNTIELTVELYIPKVQGGGGGDGKGGSGEQTFVRSGEGITIADAITNLQEKIPRELFWGHTKAIVFGEKLARKGIRSYIDFLTRHPEPRLRAYLFVAKGTAKDVLALHPPLERSPSEVLRELAKSEVLMDVTLKKLMQMLNGEGQSGAIPLVQILPPEKVKDPMQTIAYFRQTAIFKKDKMVGQINDKMTRGVLWFRDEMKYGNISIKPKDGYGYVSNKILQSSSELIPKIEDGKWKMTIKILTEEDVIANGSHLDLSNPKIIQQVQKVFEEDLKERLTQTLKKVQKEKKADILDFAGEFHRKYPKEWKRAKNNWDEIFPTVEVTYDIRIKIERAGLSSDPQGLPKDEVKKK